MKVTIDTQTERYADAARRLRQAYVTTGVPESPVSRAARSYPGKAVLEPLPAVCFEPATETPGQRDDT